MFLIKLYLFDNYIWLKITIKCNYILLKMMNYTLYKYYNRYIVHIEF